jgi:hypothetical protein
MTGIPSTGTDMATLNIWNAFSLDTQGSEKSGKQGSASDDPKSPFAVTVEGSSQAGIGSITTANTRQLWASASDDPSTFAYFHFWADQITYLQFITAATNFTIKVAAKQPFVLPGYGTLLAAATTTVITTTEPTLAVIASIYMGNYSGVTANYAYHVIK